MRALGRSRSSARIASISEPAAYPYVDASALVKLVVPEAETAALHDELRRWPRLKSSALVRTEVVRAAAVVSPKAREVALELVESVDLIAVDQEILDEAARLEPPSLRSLDAVHLASALSLGAGLGAVVTYDRRLQEGARRAGLRVLAPR